MLNHRFLALAALMFLIVLSACSSNKQIEVEPEPVRNPLALAHQAASIATENYEDGMLENAIMEFNNAIALFEEAAPTASVSDSIAQNIESMQLNIAKTHIDLAFESIEVSMFNEAIDHYETALNIYKNHTPVGISKADLDKYIIGTLNNLAIVSKDSHNYEAALAYYNQILEMEPDNAEVLNAKFFVLKDDIKDSEQAFQVLEDYTKVANDAAAYVMLAEGYAQAGEYNKAETAYKTAENLRPGADMFTRIANFYRANSEWEKANIYLEKLAATRPEASLLAVVYSQIAENYNQLKNNAKMIEYFEKSLEIKADPRIALSLAAQYNRTKNWSKVVQYSTMVLSDQANNSDARMLRGVAYYQQKNYTAAKADLERLTADPKYGSQAQAILKAIK
ncbi:MAG: tetratricopeptide repeat protein [Candidatus Cloacimonetes bacterium]|nr:tetratricopeptide repeat protein [Candidatus Cloacimonadota bacterium]MCK9332424.1 tetratricopeptide repeat protein [Candidatus Cloacimonadota bacterium]MDD2210073.1 tetratricopeptide repeat protein [Candidatus Cloacimonadota bacterium]MDY0299013.1 tetratricopeptide repeat protein [Candidatus Cloacimonadaceae bacterium]